MDVGVVQATVTLLACADLDPTSTDLGDRDLVDLLRGLEELKAAAAAAQARAAEVLRAREVTARGERGQAWGASIARSVGAQVGLARRESPHRGRELVGFAASLVGMPRLAEAFAWGRINERRAMIVASEAVDLPPAARAVYDEALAGDPSVLDGLGDVKVRDAARRQAYRLDPDTALHRRERAERSRSVSCRRGYATDGMAGMAGISGWVTDTNAAAIMTSLAEAAAGVLARRETDDPDADDPDAVDVRTRGQVMADLFVSRLTNQPTAVATPVAVKLVVSAETLLADDDEPGVLEGVGPIPAEVARRLIDAAPDVRTSVQRLFRFPGTDALVAMESTQRVFTGQLRAFVLTRDAWRCRSPYCNAPAVHVDHPLPAADGGPTSAVNGQGLCAACNYTKEHPGWTHTPTPDQDGSPQPHEVLIRTPTGHTHPTRAPDPPRPPEPPTTVTRTYPLEIHWPCTHHG